MSPTVALGMTLHNNARHLPESIDSLLAQSDTDFGLLLLDDGSSDNTADIAQAYAETDSRIRLEHHAVRQGMVQAWRAAVDLALGHFPDARYFAWTSDHDRWHPEWLRRTRAVLDAHPETVLAYPRTRRIDEQGEPWVKHPKIFDTADLQTAEARWLRFSGEAVGAGDLVYGLMRVDALRRAGVFRSVMLPDRLLMLELTLQGQFRQVQEDLWFRRQGASSLSRQRMSLFTSANAPAGLWLPPRVQHARVLRREYVRTTRPEISAHVMSGLIWRYLALDLWRQYSKSTAVLHQADNARETLAHRAKTMRRRIWAAWYEGRAVLTAWWGRLRRHQRSWSHAVQVVRRRLRAARYESRMAAVKTLGRARRIARRVLHHMLVLTHRLGLRGRS